MNKRVLDSERTEVKPGCHIIFSYGIPPIRVRAEVIERNGSLIALTPGHNPAEANVRTLKKYVGYFYVEAISPQATALEDKQ